MATDLRGVSLVIAAPLFLLIVAAKGETIVNRVYPLDRGFLEVGRKMNPMWCENSTDNGVILSQEHGLNVCCLGGMC
ncbi:hypothetical protein [Bartonella krasnovii]|uniref:hypothetical protein n=1 Tax=Bartonella krasnovii TaxID=2267275 RepID=UPI003B985619